MANLLPIVSNRKLYPYYGGSNNDSIQIKFSLKSKNRPMHQSGIKVELWLNHQGAWSSYDIQYTNRYGVIEFNYPCAAMINIDNCLAKAVVSYGGDTYDSNIIRLNFVNSISIVYDIDAGDCDVTPIDRSSYDVFDSQSRVQSANMIIDRMLS